ncbi:unnamed protein product [Ceratitis capitata]|uniref:(Mediterranean fruit fly) hypothetical protein n=1 Tax=Ceratitis capitata TaxID=7213 RepID=A0A811VB00_CERCA|nr:unnamed protein product [Ceratitis capitata]
MRGIFLALIIGLAAAQAERLYSQSIIYTNSTSRAEANHNMTHNKICTPEQKHNPRKFYRSAQHTEVVQPCRLIASSIRHERATYYGVEVEGIDFNSPPAAASNEQTQAMLVGAIHFKAKWAKEFSKRDTEKQNFYVTPTRSISVDMMYADDTFRYSEFPELDAAGLELQYANSNISMMILLPKKRNGLAEMEQRLRIPI